jgi:hypothetical protein
MPGDGEDEVANDVDLGGDDEMADDADLTRWAARGSGEVISGGGGEGRRRGWRRWSAVEVAGGGEGGGGEAWLWLCHRGGNGDVLGFARGWGVAAASGLYNAAPAADQGISCVGWADTMVEKKVQP